MARAGSRKSEAIHPLDRRRRARAAWAAMDLNTWLIYLLAAIGLSLSPGPNGLLALTHGALHGRRKALYTIGGGALGFVSVIALSMFGIGALLMTSLVWLTAMKWVAGFTSFGSAFKSGARRR